MTPLAPVRIVLETAVALAFGHSLADFLHADRRDGAPQGAPARPAAARRHRHRRQLGGARLPARAASCCSSIAASHFAIDWLKLRHGSGSFGPFVIDQAAHLFMIVLGATLFPAAWADGPLGARARPLRAPAAGDGARRRLRLHRLGRRLRRPGADVRPHAARPGQPAQGRPADRPAGAGDDPDAGHRRPARRHRLSHRRQVAAALQRPRPATRTAGSASTSSSARSRASPGASSPPSPPSSPSPPSALEAAALPHYLRSEPSRGPACSAFPASRPSP